MNNQVIDTISQDILQKPVEVTKNNITENIYANLLDTYHLNYKKESNYFVIGEIDWTQGWIIDLSVIVMQFPDLLNKILPFLIYEKITFKIVRNAKIARSMIGGELGYLLLGKLIVIYPKEPIKALEIVKELIGLTSSFRGPRILTDRHLGSIIYTRYGACNPVIRVDTSGREEKCIYDSRGLLVKDPFTIPFQLPEGVDWPFSSLASSESPKLETVLQDKYRPMKLLKEDAKGSVRKGLFLEKWWRIKWCVIKEGKQNMIADDQGRDATDRLRWQWELHKNLRGAVPLPVIYDLFTENGDSYLAMEYIKGNSLNTVISEIFKDRTWRFLPIADRLRLLAFADQILDIITRMHDLGYLHRDITTVNFIVRKEDHLCMIDLELAYSENLQKPFPPFRLGTPGFMSPEQEAARIPTVQQDIYAIGALLLNLLTSLSPGKFAADSNAILEEQLLFFLGDAHFVNILVRCMDSEPTVRPSLPDLSAAIERFRKKQLESYIEAINAPDQVESDPQAIKLVIESALQALAGKSMMNSDYLWLSKVVQEPGFVYQQEESVTVYPYLCMGLSGVLYVLSRAQKIGFSVHSCKHAVEKSLTYIRENAIRQFAEMPAGLNYGSAGMALALAEGVEAGLLPNEEKLRDEIKSYLLKENVEGLDIVRGISGQGIALLKATPLLGKAFIYSLLQPKLDLLLAQQQEDGSWITKLDEINSYLKVTGWGHGVAGIVLFLLEYIKAFGHTHNTGVARQAAINGLDWLSREAVKKDQRTIWNLHTKTKFYSPGLQDGFAGVALSLIKGYEIFNNAEYKKLAEECLNSYPLYGIYADITLSAGLVGYGETCLEAASVFKSKDCLERAHWVAQFLIHYFKIHKDGSLYWLPTDNIPTAGLLEGNSGIIHFLMRCYCPGKLSHPFLVQ